VRLKNKIVNGHHGVEIFFSLTCFFKNLYILLNIRLFV